MSSRIAGRRNARHGDEAVCCETGTGKSDGENCRKSDRTMRCNADSVKNCKRAGIWLAEIGAQQDRNVKREPREQETSYVSLEETLMSLSSGASLLSFTCTLFKLQAWRKSQLYISKDCKRKEVDRAQFRINSDQKKCLCVLWFMEIWFKSLICDKHCYADKLILYSNWTKANILNIVHLNIE